MLRFDRSVNPSHLLPLLLALSAACEDDSGDLGARGNPRLLDAGADSSLLGEDPCFATTVRVSQTLAADPTLLGFRACDVDQDCMVLGDQFECPAQDISTGFCTVRINRSNTEAARARIVSLEGSLCSQLTPHCRSAGKCTHNLACVEHVCTTVTPDAGAR